VKVLLQGLKPGRTACEFILAVGACPDPEEKDFSQDLLRDEPLIRKVTYLKHCRDTSIPQRHLCTKRMGGDRWRSTLPCTGFKGRIYPSCATHTSIEALQTGKDGEARLWCLLPRWFRDADGVLPATCLQLRQHQIENPHYARNQSRLFDTPKSSIDCRHNPRVFAKPVNRRSMG